MGRTALLLDCNLDGVAAFPLREAEGGWVVEAPFSIPCAPEDPADKLLGMRHRERIVAALEERKLVRRDMVVALPRAVVELRILGLPAAPQEEWPEMVRFAALRDFPNLTDDVALDYAPLADALALAVAPPVAEGVEREFHTHMAAAPATLLQAARDLAQAANAKLLHVVPRPFLAARLAPEAVVRRGGALSTPEGEPIGRLLIECHDEQVECEVLEGETPILCRSVRLGLRRDLAGNGAVDSDAAAAAAAQVVKSLAAEIRRTLIAGTQALHGRPIQDLWFVSASPADLKTAEALAVELGRPVLPLELATYTGKTTAPVGEALSAAAVGTALLLAQRERPLVDLATPRKRPAPPSRTRLYTLAATAAAVLFGGGYWWIASGLAELDEQIADKQAEIASLEQQNQKVSKYVVHMASADNWFAGEVVWLDEFTRLSKDWGDAREVMITQLSAGPREPGGELRIEATAKESRLVAPLAQRLRTDHHQVEVGSGRAVTDGGQYGWRFDGRIWVQPERNQVAKAATAPGKSAPASAAALSASAGSGGGSAGGAGGAFSAGRGGATSGTASGSTGSTGAASTTVGSPAISTAPTAASTGASVSAVGTAVPSPTASATTGTSEVASSTAAAAAPATTEATATAAPGGAGEIPAGAVASPPAGGVPGGPSGTSGPPRGSFGGPRPGSGGPGGEGSGGTPGGSSRSSSSRRFGGGSGNFGRGNSSGGTPGGGNSGGRDRPGSEQPPAP